MRTISREIPHIKGQCRVRSVCGSCTPIYIILICITPVYYNILLGGIYAGNNVTIIILLSLTGL